MTRLRQAFSLVAVMCLLSGCAAHDSQPGAASASAAPRHDDNNDIASRATGSSDLSSRVLTDDGVEHTVSIATSVDPSIDIWDKPGGEVVSTINASDVLTAPDVTPLVFLVKSQQADWFEVYLPVRPNGSTGWVPRSKVTLAGTDLALDVYLGEHSLILSKKGVERARFSVGVGRTDRPTPNGVYYLRELLIPPDPTGIYGPYAYGLSGYSPVLDNFRGGDAVIGLHGTNDLTSVGGDVSSGCLRMNNADVTALVEMYQLPLGTPVYIHE